MGIEKGGKIGISFTEKITSGEDMQLSKLVRTQRFAELTADALSGDISYDMIDGDIDTFHGVYGYWSDTHSYFTIDLGSIVKSDTFRVYQGNLSNPCGYMEIQFSNDNAVWVTAADFKPDYTNVGWKEVTFAEVSARYMRIHSYWGVRRVRYFYEIELWGTDEISTEILKVEGNVPQYTKVPSMELGPLLPKSFIVDNVAIDTSNSRILNVNMRNAYGGLFKDVEGDVTVTYDMTKGTLRGIGGSVETFSIPFTPTGLERDINPYLEHTLSAQGIVTLAKPYNHITFRRYANVELDKYVVKLDSLGAVQAGYETVGITALPNGFGTATVDIYVDDVLVATGTNYVLDMTALTLTDGDIISVKVAITDVYLTSIVEKNILIVQEGSNTVRTVASQSTVYIVNDVQNDFNIYVDSKVTFKIFYGDADITDEWIFSRVDGTGILTQLFENSIRVLELSQDSSVGITATHAVHADELFTTQFVLDTRGYTEDGFSPMESISASSIVFLPIDFFWSTGERRAIVETSSYLVEFDNTNTIKTAFETITLTASLMNCPTPTVKFYVDNALVQDGSSLTYDFDAATYFMIDHPLATSVEIKMSVTQGDLTMLDYVTLYKATDGSTDIVAYLDNQYHEVIATAGGDYMLFTKVKTSARVFQGTVDITDEWVFSRVDAVGVLSQLWDNHVRLLDFTENTGNVVITGEHSVHPDVVLTFTLYKSKRGETLET